MRQLPSGRWQARRVIDGQACVAPSTFDTRLDAEVWLSGGLRGSFPGQRACTLREHTLRDELARQLRGLTEVVLPYGRADVADDRFIFEVEPAKQWRHAVRQVLAYAAQVDRRPAIALFGPADRSTVLGIYLKLRDGQPPVALWWHNGSKWVAIRNREECRAVAS